MSRKTRKLMWSVPLIAAVAVIGALAAYVMLAPGGALAHSGDSVSTAHQPPGPVTKIDVTTPSIADGGRTSLRVTWNAPTPGDDATMYRVDISKDTDVWMNVIGGEMSDDMLTDADAMADCTSDDNRNRCYTAPGLDSDTLYHFRVFAMNEFGTSPISVDETLGSGMTLRIDPPARVGSLDATDYYEDKIVVSWHDVLETGGGDVLWYCLGVAASPSGAFTDLTLAAVEEDCLEAKEATAAAIADDDGVYMSPVMIESLIDPEMNDVPQTIVVAAKDEDGDAVAAYEHLGLHTPDVIELRYRLYAVTDEDGDAETVEDRRISRAASETATGRTVRPSDKPDPRFESPPAVGNLRAVVYTEALTSDDDLPDPTSDNQGLHFFWTHPDGYNPNWYLEVQRRVADEADHDKYPGWQFVTGETTLVPLAIGYGTPQFTVDFSATLDGNDPPESWAAPVLWGDDQDNRHEYRVRYVNPGADDDMGTPAHDNDVRSDDVPGTWEDITILEVSPNHLRVTADGVPTADSTLPIILLSRGNTGMGLRFEYNDDDPRDHIDLLWTRNANAREGEEGEEGPKGPNGYVIDRSADGGATWQSLARADTPTELGTADTFTDDHEVVPGHEYTYRVFPVFIEDGADAYGVPALIDANSRGADLPKAARSVSADADGQNACVVTWRAPADDGGHLVRGYLIEIARDDDGEPGTWAPINIVGGDPPFTVMGGAMTEFKYTGTAAQVGTAAELSAGSVRWFRVIPITNENDADQDTGGAFRDEVGAENSPRNERDVTNASELPLADDEERADPDKCTTEGLGDAPADSVTADPQMPVDLTAEAASDTNSRATSDRGVFLTWNQQPMGDASETTSYRINRIRMNTGVEALNDEADDWQFVKRVRDVTSYTDSTDLRRVEETRMYQVCSEASGVTEPVCVEMPATYALHPDMHMPSMPQMVEATATSATEITVSWMAPADNGGAAVTGYVLQRAYKDADDMMTDFMTIAATDAATWWNTLGCPMMNAAIPDDATPAAPADDADTDSPYCAMYDGLTDDAMEEVDAAFAADYGTITDTSYMDMGLMPDTTYYYRVRAMNAAGYGYWSDGMAMAMPEAPSFSAPANVAATSSGGTVTVTWMPGALATSQVAIVVNAADDTDYCLSVPLLAGDASSYECTDRMVGQSYVALVIALDGQGNYMLGYGADGILETHVAQ